MLAAALLSQSKGNTQAGPGGQRGLTVIMQPSPPSASCLLQPECSHIDCLEISLESVHSQKWYRPDFKKLEDINTSAYPKSVQSRSSISWTVEAFVLPHVIQETPLYTTTEEEG